MYETLIAAFAQASGDAEIGALLLAGSHGVFTAGNDIGDFLSAAMAAAAQAKASRRRRASPSRLARFDKPLVAAIDGAAIGVGATLCFHCDLVYATTNARFSMPFVNLGLTPEAGSSLLAPLRFGAAKAAEFLLLAEPFDAETALRLGLVNALRRARSADRPRARQSPGPRRQAARSAARQPPPAARRPRCAASRTWMKRSGSSTSACARPKRGPRSRRSWRRRRVSAARRKCARSRDQRLAPPAARGRAVREPCQLLRAARRVLGLHRSLLRTPGHSAGVLSNEHGDKTPHRSGAVTA